MSQGCTLIFTVGFALSAATLTAAEANPDIQFALLPSIVDNHTRRQHLGRQLRQEGPAVAGADGGGGAPVAELGGAESVGQAEAQAANLARPQIGKIIEVAAADAAQALR